MYAKKLVHTFGEKVFEVIEAAPDRLRDVDGIGPVRAASILTTWAEQKAVREIMGHEARTIHRLLEVDPKTGGFRRGPDNPLDCDHLVVDEWWISP
jgi:ATP-dependent exoDNAse (exonuclease V) alpha subunit